MLNYPSAVFGDIDEENEFPVFGFYLIDMNFDKIPELAVRRHSGGTLGGYFLYYYFDGEEVKPVLNSDGEPARSMDNDWVKLLADFENNKIYILKEFCMFGGNDNFNYGYVREIITDENGAIFMNNILDLTAAWGASGEKDYIYSSENEYLSDPELDGLLITRIFADGEWYDISSVDYLEIKLSLIPEENEFIDLFETEVFCLLYEYPMGIGEDEGIYRQITEEEIDLLFAAWLAADISDYDED